MSAPADVDESVSLFKFQTTKLRSWRSGYSRIVSLHPSFFTTIDPETFSETNRYQWADMTKCCVGKDGGEDGDGWTFEVGKDKFKYKCLWRASLLTEMKRAQFKCLLRLGKSPDAGLKVFGGQRQQRTGERVPTKLVVRPYGLIELDHVTLAVLQEYDFQSLSKVGFLSDDPRGLIIHHTGRGRLFLIDGEGNRSDLASKIKTGSEEIGVKFNIGEGVTTSQFSEARLEYGSDAGDTMCSYSVTKRSRRHKDERPRNLVITQSHILEKDVITGNTVSSRLLTDIFAIVRNGSSSMEVRIEYKDGQARSYSCNRRDALVCSLLDATLTTGNSDVCVTEGVSDGYRLLPRGEREETVPKGGIIESFLGPDTVEIWYLKRLGRVAQARLNASGLQNIQSDGCPEVVVAALEFNANVSPEGVAPSTDKKFVMMAIQPILGLLSYLGNVRASEPGSGVSTAITPLMQERAEAAASTLLQAVFRIVKCVSGFRYFLEIGDVLPVMANLLTSRDQFTAYWAVKILGVLVACPFSPRNREQEFVNKQVLLAPPAITNTLVGILVGGSRSGWDDAPAPSGPTPEELRQMEELKRKQQAEEAERLRIEELQRLQLNNNNSVGNNIAPPPPLDPADRAPTSSPIPPIPPEPAVQSPPKKISTLVLMAVSELLESVLCSGHDTTAPERFETLAHSLSEGYGSLMDMLRSPCALIVENAAILLQMITHHKPECGVLVRDSALSSATLLRHFYNAIFSPSSCQRFLSRYLVTLWMSGPPTCAEKQLLSRILPSGFIPYLKMPVLSDTEMENLDDMEGGGIESTNTFSRLENNNGGNNAGGTNIKRLRGRIGMANLKTGNTDKSNVENFRILFHVITQDHALPDLLWNQQTRRELRISLESELKSIERETDVRGGGGRVAWNHQQYRVPYPSLKDEVRVGNVYMRLWLEAGDAFIKTWGEPMRLFELLFRRLLCDMDRNTTITNMCIRCLERLYAHHIDTIGTFNDVMILVRSMALTTSVETQHRFLSLLATLLGVTKNQDDNDKVRLQIPGNAEQLLNSESIAQLCQYVAWGHTNSAQIGNLLHRASVGESANMITDGSDVGPEGHKGEGGGDNAGSDTADNNDNKRRKAPDASCPQVWFVAPSGQIPPPPNKIRGPFRVSELRQFIDTGDLHSRALVTAAHVEDYGSEGEDDVSGVKETAIDTGKWRVMEDVWQLRWQLCTEGQGVYTPSQISLVALRALTRLVDMHKSVDCRGVPYHPIPIAKKLLCGLASGEAASESTGMEQRDSLFVIAQSMLCNDNEVVDTAAQLLHKLMMHNDEACAKLYLTGVFMFGVGYTGSNFHSIARLLHDTHLKQNFRSGFAAAANADDLPLNVRSILGNLLPEGLLYMLFNYGPERFTEVFVGDFDTPEVIWNFRMRKHLVDMIRQHLGDFPKRLWQNTCSKYEYCPIPGIAYKRLERELFCHNYYLSNLCDEVKFPDWPIAEPVEVLRACLEEWKKEMSRDTVKEEDAADEARKVLNLKVGDGSAELRKSYRSLARKYHPDKNPGGREMFEKIQAAYELLLPIVEAGGVLSGSYEDEEEEVEEEEGKVYEDANKDDGSSLGLVGGMSGMHNIGLLMRTQVILCKRHAAEVGVYKYPAYKMLVEVLKLPAGKSETVLLPRRAEFVRTAVDLVFQTCLVSPLNAEELVAEGAVPTLEELLNFYISSWKETEKDNKLASKNLRLEIIMHVVHTIAGVCYFASGRAAILSLEDPTRLCENWRRCVSGAYWGDAPLVKKYALEGLSNMARDAALQTLLVGAGNVWQLIRSLLMYDPSLEEVNIENDGQVNQQMSQAASNTHALLSCKALGMLSGSMINELETPANPILTRALKKMLTRPLAKLLRNKRAGDLLRVLNTNVETPTRIWNISMRNELLKFLDNMEEGRDEAGCRTMAEELGPCDDILYSNLKNEVIIGDVYVRVFNSLGGGREGIREIEDSSGFCAALLRFTERSLNGGAGKGEVEVAESGAGAGPGAGAGAGAGASGEKDDETNDESDCAESLWHDVKDKRFVMAITALRLLVLVDGLVDEVLCKREHRGPAILLSLLELPQDCAAFDIATDILNLMAPKARFADAVAVNNELWRLLRVLEGEGEGGKAGNAEAGGEGWDGLVMQTKEEGDVASANASAKQKRHIQGWNVLEALGSTPSIAVNLLKTSGWVELLGILVGYNRFTKSYESRKGAAKTLARLLWDPKTKDESFTSLGKFLPLSLVSMLKEGTEGMLRVFDENAETPELIWDGEMRIELRNSISEILNTVLDDTTKRGDKWNLEGGFRVKYVKLEDELYIGGVYVRLFLKEPTYNLRDPTGFLEMCMKKWAEELTILTRAEGGGAVAGGGGSCGDTALTAAKQDTLQLVTSACVYICKVRAPLCDKLANWGYMGSAVNFIQASAARGMRGSPLVAAVRVLHVGSSRRSNVEAIALAEMFVELMKEAIADNNNNLHADSAFMVEILFRVYKDALGEVDNVLLTTTTNYAGAAVGAGADGNSVPGSHLNDGTINARSAPDEQTVATQQAKNVAGAPNCAHGRVALLNLALRGNICGFLVTNVLENSGGSGAVVDKAALKVHSVALLKLLTKDPGYGMQFKLLLDAIPAWRNYKSQDHSLFITGTEQRADYFLTNGGRGGEKMLTQG